MTQGINFKELLYDNQGLSSLAPFGVGRWKTLERGWVLWSLILIFDLFV